MAKVEASRFAILKIEDDYDSDEKRSGSGARGVGAKGGVAGGKQGGKQGAAGSASQAAKKKAKKKAAESQESGSGKGAKKPVAVGDKQWDDWSKVDDQYVEDAFEKELAEAIVTSKLQYEEHKLGQASSGSQQNGSSTTAGKKKNKKKDKPVAMSLEQFSQADLSRKTQNDSDESDAEREPRQIAPTTFIPPGEGDTRFFDRVNDDVRQIVRRENAEKEFKKSFAVESVQTSKLQKELELKDKEVIMLRATAKKLEEELQQVKKRNQQLCHILGQGEMKDKTALLLEVDDLRQVRDDLTQEVTRLTSDLEKERSKVHGLKGDIDKAKGAAGKHK